MTPVVELKVINKTRGYGAILGPEPTGVSAKMLSVVLNVLQQ